MNPVALFSTPSRCVALALLLTGTLLAQRNVTVSVAGNELTSSGSALVALASQGDENALGFTLTFDPMVLRFDGATNGADVTGATVHVNSNQAATGRLAVVLALPSGTSFAPGQRALLEVKFSVVAASRTNTAIGFADAPVAREISDPRAHALTATYTGATVSAGKAPAGSK